MDVLEFQREVDSLMINLTGAYVVFDLQVNTALTTALLDLLTTYVGVFDIFCNFDDRRLITCLFEAAHNASRGGGHAGYPRLAEMIYAWTNPYKLLYKAFYAHTRVLQTALARVGPVLMSRLQNASQLRGSNFLSLTHAPADLAKPIADKAAHLNYISLSTLVRWVCFGYLLVPGALQAEPEPGAMAGMVLLKMALSEVVVVQVFRNLGVNIHEAYIALLSVQDKAMKPLEKEFKEQYAATRNTCAEVHFDRRVYLRQELHTLVRMFKDKPSMIGPKASMLLSGIALARSEMMWLFLHRYSPAIPKSKKWEATVDFLLDDKFGRLLHLATKLDSLLVGNRTLVSRYHTEFLAGLDAVNLRQLVSALALPDAEQAILANLMGKMETLPATFRQQEALVKEKRQARVAMPSMDGVRLDVQRLQQRLCSQASETDLMTKPHLANALNLINFHLSMVDEAPKLALQVGGTGELLFFDEFQTEFKRALEDPAEFRSLMAYPYVCQSFEHFGSKHIPGEVDTKCALASQFADSFLSRIAQRAIQQLDAITLQEIKLSKQMTPAYAVDILMLHAENASAANATMKDGRAQPGSESMVHDGTPLVDQLKDQHQALSDLSWAMDQYKSVKVRNFTLIPKEYMRDQVKAYLRFVIQRELHRSTTEGTGLLPRPSVLWDTVKSVMTSLRHLEAFINLDIATILESGLLEQVVSINAKEKTTVAQAYSNFYREVVLNKTAQGGICCSAGRRAFVTLDPRSAFKAEEYTDATELEALCLLIGPYGVEQLDASFLDHISMEIGKMKGFVANNSASLKTLKVKTDKIQSCQDALEAMRADVAQFTICGITIGTVLIFREMLKSALRSVLLMRVPFISKFVTNLHEHSVQRGAWDSLAGSTGLRCSVDPGVLKAMRQHCRNEGGGGFAADIETWGNMMGMTAASLWYLAHERATVFNAGLDAHENNAHALATMAAQLSASAFTIMADSPDAATESVTNAQGEFLRIASVCLLRLGNKSNSKSSRGSQRDAVYVILDRLVAESDFITNDTLEKFFPYSLIRNALKEVYATAK